MKLLPLLLLASAFLTSFSVLSATEAASDEENVEKLRQALAKTMPQVQPTKISKTPIDGLYEVIVGSQVVYMSVDSRYMIEGDLYDLRTKKNISESAKSVIRLAVIDKLGEESMLIYRPEKVKDVITVITDIDCPYCRKLHSEIDEYMKYDVEVRYIFMPLKGSSDMRKTVSVWCSDDPQLALDMAKAGSEIEQKTCDNPIKQHLAVARELGVRGTPAILLESGELLPGYVPVNTLIKEIRK
ncbi:MAG: DsbC family protein [Proteobacteria bacterium]|nr:DsbC family protein [Pseudomonadota bacterium]